MKAPINEKFVAYGGPAFTIDAELKCRVISINGDELYVAPYQNYYHLLLEGNHRKPVQGEDGYAWYRDNITAHAGVPEPPIMKLETYQVGGRPGSNPAGQAPMLDDAGRARPVQVSDHIRIRGLYAIDYSHTMYFYLHTSSFTYMRGLYKAAFVHSELHPYNFGNIELITHLQPGPELFDEFHTIVAPVYPQVYSKTYEWNKITGKAGHFVDEAKQSTISAGFFINAPPRPGLDYEPRLIISDEVRVGSGGVNIASTQVGDSGYSVTVTVTGSNVLNPLVHSGKYAVRWLMKSKIEKENKDSKDGKEHKDGKDQKDKEAKDSKDRHDKLAKEKDKDAFREKIEVPDGVQSALGASPGAPDVLERISELERRIAELESERAVGQPFVEAGQRPPVGERTIAEANAEDADGSC